MNINEQLKEITELKERLKVLENEVLNSVQPKQEYKRWRAKKGEYYYYCINSDNEVIQNADTGCNVENSRYEIGNYFKTEKEAEEYKENLITKQKLKDLALRLNQGVEIDWKDIDQFKFSIVLDNMNEALYQIANSNDIKIGNIYCLDEQFLDIAKEEIGEEALIKLIKSGV